MWVLSSASVHLKENLNKSKWCRGMLTGVTGLMELGYGNVKNGEESRRVIEMHLYKKGISFTNFRINPNCFFTLVDSNLPHRPQELVLS